MISGSNLLSGAVVQALGWTLVHSLWQAAAAALLLWLLLPQLRNAAKRYWAAYGALVAVLLAAVASFAWVYEPGPSGVGSATDPVSFGTEYPAGIPVLTSPNEPFSWSRIGNLLEPYYPVIVTLWLLGFAVFLLQLFGGLRYLYRLRHRNNRPAEPVWLDKLHRLCAKLGTSRPVVLLESALVQAPVALGFFKPVILLPIGLVNHLSPAEVEAILAHELAHIARRDWLFNLLQALIEAVFYYHPAVWWISATIRAERENCCDDTAVALTGNRLVYAKTLVRLQDLSRSASRPALALGIDGSPSLLRRRPLLLERIRRILHQPQQSASLMEKAIATAILVALITLLTLRANTPPALAAAIHEIASEPIAWITAAPQNEPAQTGWQAAPDSLPKPQRRQKIVREEDNRRVEIELESGKIIRLNVDGKDIPSEQYAQFQELTDELLEEAIPPTPPAPPAAPFWRTPAPFAPPAPPARISADKDADGNTIIRLERNGNPMEIRVKDGEVWIEGKKVEKGQSMNLPADAPVFLWEGGDGQHILLDSQQFHIDFPDHVFLYPPTPPDAPKAFRFDEKQLAIPCPNPELFELQALPYTNEQLQRLREETLLSQELHRKALKEALKEQEKAMKESGKQLGKAQKEYRKAQEEARRELEKAQKEQRMAVEEYNRARERALFHQLDQERASAERQRERALFEHRSAESVGKSLKEALIRDHLIGDPNNFSLDLSGKEMRVNGQKQPPEIHEKYLELYRQQTGKPLDKKDSFRIEEDN